MTSAETTPVLGTDAGCAGHGTVPPLVVRLSDSVTIIMGDCRDVLPTLGPVDAVVTDPPYGAGYATRPICGKGKKQSNHAP